MDKKDMATRIESPFLALKKLKNLLSITDEILQKDTISDEIWMQVLWNWADKNNNPDYQYPENNKVWMGLSRNKKQLLYITAINLSNNQLTELPESVGNLTQLTLLILDNNELNKLPESIFNLTQLTQLSLSNNQLTELPE